MNIKEIEYVVNNSKFVTINREQIDKFVDVMKINDYHSWYEEYNLNLEEKERIILAFLLESINYCAWQRPKYQTIYHGDIHKGIQAIFSSYIKKVEKDKNFLDINNLTKLSYSEFRNIFDKNLSIPYKRYETFMNTVNIINKKGEKFYNELFLLKTDLDLVNYITEEFESFKDISIYQNKVIHFYKRATLLVTDLFYLSNKVKNKIKNLDHLFGCADYGVPRVLRDYGILEYQEDLANQIDNNFEIKHDSEMEIEIRANMLIAVEIIKNKLQEKGIRVSSPVLDSNLWYMGTQYKSEKPYHKTITIFY